MGGLSEWLIIVIIIVVLSMTGMWPQVVRAIRELRGENLDENRSVHTHQREPENLDLCFRLLGISSTSNWDEIERAYRQKAKVHHPDRGGDADAMRALNEAYNTLKKYRRNQN
jgi:chorismate mutase